MLIEDIYHPKVKTISTSDSVLEAVQKMEKDNINAFIVVDDNESVVGVLSLQDIAGATVPRQFRQNIRMAAAMYKVGFFTEMSQKIKSWPVSKVMRRDFVQVSLRDNIMAITADFLNNDLYIVPVIEKGKLIGIVTRTEIRDALLYGMRKNPDED